MTNRETLINNLNSYFFSFWTNKGIDIETEYKQIPTNRFNACMLYIYDNYINTLEIFNKSKGVKQYIASDYIVIIEWYISKCLDYDFISLNGACCLLNRDTSWINNLKFSDTQDYNNSFIFIVENNNSVENSCIDINNINSDNNYISDVVFDTTCGGVENLRLLTQDITKKLFQTIQQSTVNKLNDTTIGLVTNANNNKDIGLMYAKERIQETAKARAMISLNDLPMLE